MKIRNNAILFLLTFIFCIAVFALVLFASKKTVFHDYKVFENESWNADSIVTFDYLVSDTISKNKIIIKLKHTTDYSFQNLFLFVKGEKKDTIELLLANKEGEWVGEGVGNLREVEFLYAESKKFSKKGSFVFELEQAMRYGPLEQIQELNHIKAVGLIIKKSDE